MRRDPWLWRHHTADSPHGPSLSFSRCRAVCGHRDVDVPLLRWIDGACASHCDHTTTLRYHGTPRVGRRPANRVPPCIQRDSAARHEDFEIRLASVPDHAALCVVLRNECAGPFTDLVQALCRALGAHVLDARGRAWRCRQQQPERQSVSRVRHGVWKVRPCAFSVVRWRTPVHGGEGGLYVLLGRRMALVRMPAKTLSCEHASARRGRACAGWLHEMPPKEFAPNARCSSWKVTEAALTMRQS